MFKVEYSLCPFAVLVLHLSTHKGNAGWSPPISYCLVSCCFHFQLYSVSKLFSAVTCRLIYWDHKHKHWNFKQWRKSNWDTFKIYYIYICLVFIVTSDSGETPHPFSKHITPIPCWRATVLHSSCHGCFPPSPPLQFPRACTTTRVVAGNEIPAK